MYMLFEHAEWNKWPKRTRTSTIAKSPIAEISTEEQGSCNSLANLHTCIAYATHHHDVASYVGNSLSYLHI